MGYNSQSTIAFPLYFLSSCVFTIQINYWKLLFSPQNRRQSSNKQRAGIVQKLRTLALHKEEVEHFFVEATSVSWSSLCACLIFALFKWVSLGGWVPPWAKDQVVWDGARAEAVSTAPQKGLMTRAVFLGEVRKILSADLSAFELLIILQLGKNPVSYCCIWIFL